MRTPFRLFAVALAFISCAMECHAAKTPDVAQAAVGTCNQNSVTIQTASSTGNGPSRPNSVAGPVVKSPGLPCVVVQMNHQMNALEHAQLQLLIAEHPSQVSTGSASLRLRLGEQVASIWLDVRNDSPYDVHSVSIEVARKKAEKRLNFAQEQTYLTEKLPDAVVTSRNLILSSGEGVKLLAANPSFIARMRAELPESWCFYDVSERASDWDVEGFNEATTAELEKNTPDGELRSVHAPNQSIPLVFTLRYADIFNLPHETPIQLYLRAASLTGGTVFYPSRRVYGPVQCIAILAHP